MTQSPTKSRTYEKDQIEAAKKLYMEFKLVPQIAESTGMKGDAIKYYIKNGWFAEREAIQSEIINAMTDSKRNDLIEITSHGLTFLKKSLQKLTKDAEVNPSPGLLKTISTIVFEINKIKALDDGMATEIVGEIKPSSVVEIRELLKKDPFHEEIEDASFTES